MKLYHNFKLTKYNSYGISSIVKTAIFPESIIEVAKACLNNPKAIIIGEGNNIIFSKPIYEETFIFIRENLSDIELFNNNSIITYSGCQMSRLSEFACKNSLSGFESFFDIPGSVGGGIFMNAGNDKQTISETLVKVWAYNRNTNNIEIIEKSDCLFSYRNSLFKQNRNLIILKSMFTSKYGEQKEISDLMLKSKATRISKQPRDFPNAGSVFKRPDGYFVGSMIESLELKGYSIGGAQVSEKHAGFIINKKEATGDDILKLIAYIQRQVFEKYEVKLQLEQIII